MFDSSVARGKPATLSLEDVIRGWTEGMQLMVEGERTRFSQSAAPRLHRRRGPAQHAGIAARVFNTIRDINVLLISQGASSINLTFVVEEQHADEAVRRLHEAFFECATSELLAHIGGNG